MSEQSRIVGLIEAAVSDAVRAQLASYGYEASEGPPPCAEGERSYSASLGYTSADVRGVLVVQGTSRLWSAIFTALVGGPPVATMSAEALCDVAGELANVVAGRVKRVLLTEGVEVVLAVPSGTHGVGLHSEALGKGTGTLWRHLHTPDGVLTVCNAVRVEAGIVLEISPSVAPVGGEGELIVF